MACAWAVPAELDDPATPTTNVSRRRSARLNFSLSATSAPRNGMASRKKYCASPEPFQWHKNEEIRERERERRKKSFFLSNFFFQLIFPHQDLVATAYALAYRSRIWIAATGARWLAKALPLWVLQLFQFLGCKFKKK